ncbi:MAG: cyclic nucleotide-binding domain-containing protein [Rhodospirillaceae bacterium]|nr:cyclic nucleotide-binding domain-containing protein [Rhodospirillaceae bacterium]
MHRGEEFKLVRSLAPFSSMSEPGFQKLARLSYLQTFPTDVVLIEQGRPADMLHVVVDGTVELFGEHAGNSSTIALFRPVSVFILAAVVRDQPYLMSARTVEPSQLVLIPSQLIQELMEEDHAFALAMIAELAKGFRTMVTSIKNLKLRGTQQRVGAYLLVERERHGSLDRFELAYDKTLMASLLGMTRESLSRAFNALRQYGVRVRGREVIFDDAARLAAFAQPDPLIDHPN